MSMPALTQGAPTRPAPLVANTETAAFLDRHFAGQAGEFCLGFIDGDPRLEKMQIEWYSWPRQRSIITYRYAELAAQGHNLYAGMCLFSNRKRAYATALPSPWLWLDEAPADGVYTELIETSAGNYQGWLKLDQPLDADDRKHYQQRWRDASPGADACSSDATHMVRVPGGFNTKRHSTYLVHTAQHTAVTFAIAELDQRWPHVPQVDAGQPVAPLNWPEVEIHLANIDQLLTSRRVRIIKPETQTGRILRGERISFTTKHGPDDSRSMQRITMAHGLRIRGFPDEEIAAMLWARADWGTLAQKGSAWFENDIRRCICDAHRRYPDVRIEPTRYRKEHAAAPRPQVERTRRGPKQTVTPDEVFAWLCQQATGGDMAMVTRPEVAAHFGVSIGTIQRCERVLRDRGDIERRHFNRRQSSCVAILRPIIIPPAPSEEAPNHVRSAETPPAHPDAESLAQNVHGETHTPPVPPVAGAPADVVLLGPIAPVQHPALAVAVCEAFDAYNGAKKLTRKRVLDYLTRNYAPLPWSELELARAIAAERRRRELDKKLAGLADLTPAGLKAQIRLAEHLADKSRELGDATWRWWEFFRDQARAELRSRPAELPKSKPRKVCEVLPDLRAAGERYQAELWELVERARAEMPPVARGRAQGARGVVCSPQPTLEAPLVSELDASGLIARLRARLVESA